MHENARTCRQFWPMLRVRDCSVELIKCILFESAHCSKRVVACKITKRKAQFYVFRLRMLLHAGEILIGLRGPPGFGWPEAEALVFSLLASNLWTNKFVVLWAVAAHGARWQISVFWYRRTLGDQPTCCDNTFSFFEIIQKLDKRQNRRGKDQRFVIVTKPEQWHTFRIIICQHSSFANKLWMIVVFLLRRPLFHAAMKGKTIFNISW